MKRTMGSWVLAALMASAVALALPQQDEGPILRPHKPVAKPAAPAATLLVLCDLACNWKLDGKAQGVIAAGDSAKVKVELGQHVLSASTEDGLDKTRQVSEVKGAGQTAVTLDLAPVRDARLKAEREAEREAEQKALREQSDKALAKAQQEARDKAASESRERERAAETGAAGVWADPATGLMWGPRQNAISVDWNSARSYCASLSLGGYSDWRLPTINELASIYDLNMDTGHQHIKGGIQIAGAVWGYQAGNAYSGLASYFNFHDGGRYSERLETTTRATEYTLCVRSAGN